MSSMILSLIPSLTAWKVLPSSTVLKIPASFVPTKKVLSLSKLGEKAIVSTAPTLAGKGRFCQVFPPSEEVYNLPCSSPKKIRSGLLGVIAREVISAVVGKIFDQFLPPSSVK